MPQTIKVFRANFPELRKKFQPEQTKKIKNCIICKRGQRTETHDARQKLAKQYSITNEENFFFVFGMCVY